MEQVEFFIVRLQKIGIHITLVGNYPWIYIDTICGKKVKEKFYSDHGFVFAIGSTVIDIEEIFKLIRKYIQ